MSISTAVFIATAATLVSAEYTNTWWTPSSIVASSTPVESVWTPSSSAVESVWQPSSSAVASSWAPSSESVWTPSSTAEKGNISISTSYTNTVYVTKATTATQTVDCGKGTMIYGNGSAPASTPSLVLPSNMPTDLPSDWSKSIPSSILSSIMPPQISASGGIATTNCANASVTYTFTYTPSGSKPKPTSSIIETPAEPTHPSPPSSGGEVPAVGPDSGDNDAESSSSSHGSKGKPSSGFSTGDDDMDSAGSRQDITSIGALITLCVVAVAACML